jgi:hypothetical protein
LFVALWILNGLLAIVVAGLMKLTHGRTRPSSSMRAATLAACADGL